MDKDKVRKIVDKFVEEILEAVSVETRTLNKSLSKLAAKEGEIHDRKYFKCLILDVLYRDLNRKSSVKNLYEAIEKRIDLTVLDRELVSTKNGSGVPRWKKNAAWAIHYLRKEGMLESNSPRGEVELTSIVQKFKL